MVNKRKLLGKKLKKIMLTNITIRRIEERQMKSQHGVGVFGPGYYTLDLSEEAATQLINETLKTINKPEKIKDILPTTKITVNIAQSDLLKKSNPSLMLSDDIAEHYKHGGAIKIEMDNTGEYFTVKKGD